jgi:hypothetical protein
VTCYGDGGEENDADNLQVLQQIVIGIKKAIIAVDRSLLLASYL